jgi:hypothetical protein
MKHQLSSTIQHKQPSQKHIDNSNNPTNNCNNEEEESIFEYIEKNPYFKEDLVLRMFKIGMLNSERGKKTKEKEKKKEETKKKSTEEEEEKQEKADKSEFQHEISQKGASFGHSRKNVIRFKKYSISKLHAEITFSSQYSRFLIRYLS